MRVGLLEDPLRYLPRTPIQEIRKRQVIYDPEHPSNRLYMVVSGRVKIVNTAEDASQIVTQFVSAEGLFGESMLIHARAQNQTATALEKTALMGWTAADVEQKIERE